MAIDRVEVDKEAEVEVISPPFTVVILSDWAGLTMMSFLITCVPKLHGMHYYCIVVVTQNWA